MKAGWENLTYTCRRRNARMPCARRKFSARQREHMYQYIHRHNFCFFSVNFMWSLSEVNRVTCDSKTENWNDNLALAWPHIGQHTKMDRCYFRVVAGRLIEIEKSNTRTTGYNKSGKLKCINYRIGLFCGEAFLALLFLIFPPYRFRFDSYYYCHTLHKSAWPRTGTCRSRSPVDRFSTLSCREHCPFRLSLLPDHTAGQSARTH